MRLDEFRDAIDELCDAGAPQEYGVKCSLDGNTFFVSSVDQDSDGSLRIRLEE